MGIPARQWMSYSQSYVYLDYDTVFAVVLLYTATKTLN